MRPDLDDTATQAGAPMAPGDGLGEGMRLDHFRIERKLGAGGMGEVYLATDLALDRPVAIKVLADGIARDRLIREARAQARIQHPNVAHIYFIGEDAGRLYFAMEHVAGETLAQKLAAGPMPVEDALAAIRSAALGLREAQRAGITHRDVKPSNLMLDGNGHLKVLDFGLAAGALVRSDSGPVAQTTLGGTPLYMAPEQARGEPLDARADIYALGATLYHLVSGRPPFQADSVDELVTLHATAARPALPRSKANPRTAVAAIDALIAKMMAPRPDDRFGSYDELIHAIEIASAQHTRPGGFWVRSAAASIDLMIIVMGLAGVAAALPGDHDMGVFILPLGMIYSALTTARWGATAGKAMFELEVVDYRTGGRARWQQAVVRVLVQVGPVTAGSLIEHVLRAACAPSWLDFVMSMLGLAVCVLIVLLGLHAALRVPGKRPPWDRIAGTMVRYRTRRAARS